MGFEVKADEEVTVVLREHMLRRAGRRAPSGRKSRPHPWALLDAPPGNYKLGLVIYVVHMCRSATRRTAPVCLYRAM
jgi:hypothetical protein